jgi:hypothetical protein
MPDMLPNIMKKHNTKFKELIQDALKLAATQAAVVLTRDIIIDNTLADRCREPRCENYGLSKQEFPGRLKQHLKEGF